MSLLGVSGGLLSAARSQALCRVAFTGHLNIVAYPVSAESKLVVAEGCRGDGQHGGGEWEVQASSYGMSKPTGLKGPAQGMTQH